MRRTKDLREAVARNLADQGGGAVAVAKDGLKFCFVEGPIGPNSWGVVSGTMSFAGLAHIVDPGLVTLVTNA